MATSSTMVSVEEYLSTLYEPDCEYIEGEIIERNMGESDHGGLQLVLGAWLYARRREAGIHVFTEVRVQVAPRRFRIPDITVTTTRVRDRILREPPFLCVEILSPEDRMSRIEARIDDLLAFGVPYIWLIDPRRRKAWSYTKESRRDATQTLTTSNPAISLPLAEIFNALDEDVEPE